jgi:hypothetical protein
MQQRTQQRTAGRGRVVVTGTVHSAGLRTEALGARAHGLQVVSFTVLTPVAHGAARGVAVEMRGRTIHGPAPVDGQQVEVIGRYSRNGVLQAVHVRDIDTGAVVTAGGAGTIRATRVVAAVFVTIVVVGLLAGGLAFLNEQGLNPFAAQVAVPSVQPGEDLGAVDARLRDAGLRTEWIPEQSSQVPFGTVIRISPLSGTRVRSGSTVKIYENANLPK